MWKEVLFDKPDKATVVNAYRRCMQSLVIVPDNYLHFFNLHPRDRAQLLNNLEGMGAARIDVHNVVPATIADSKLRRALGGFIAKAEFVECMAVTKSGGVVSIVWDKALRSASVRLKGEKEDLAHDNRDAIVEKRLAFFKKTCKAAGIDAGIVVAMDNLHNDKRVVRGFLKKEFMDFRLTLLEDALGLETIYIEPIGKGDFTRASGLFFRLLRKSGVIEAFVVHVSADIPALRSLIGVKGGLITGSDGGGRFSRLKNPDIASINKDILGVLEGLDFKENQVFGFGSKFSVESVPASQGQIELSYRKNAWHLEFSLPHEDAEIERFLVEKRGFRLRSVPF